MMHSARSDWKPLVLTDQDVPLTLVSRKGSFSSHSWKPSSSSSSSDDTPPPPVPRKNSIYISPRPNRTSAYHPIEIDHPTRRERWFNRGHNNNDEKKPWGPKSLNLLGWRMGVFWGTCSVTFVFLLNLVITIWATATYDVVNGLGTIFEGSCNKTKSMSLWMHLAINIFSSIVLSASNYTQQCLMAPTRAEVNRSHARGEWMDIGVPSVRNIGSIARKRAVLWWAIALMSVPLHLLYNSAVYSTIAATTYKVTIAQENVLAPGAPPLVSKKALEVSAPKLTFYTNSETYWSHNLSPPTTMAKWDKLSPEKCISEYNQAMLITHGNLLVVMYGSPNTTMTAKLVFNVLHDVEEPQNWMCCITKDLPYYKELSMSPSCSNSALLAAVRAGGNWTIPESTGAGGTVKECYSETFPEVCKLQFSTTILAIVIVANAVKAACMALVLRDRTFRPLITLGDAIESFLVDADATTAGICYASRQLVVRKHRTGQAWNTGALRPWRWKPIRYRWFRAVSITRWATTLVVCTTVIAISAALLGMALRQDSQTGTVDISSMWRRGFGKVNISSTVHAFGDQMDIHAAALLANIPQAILSLLYLMYNALFTSMLMAREYCSFATTRRGLRVSVPRGGQRDTYWLHLPYRFALPLGSLSALLHWLTSQSLFLARIDVRDRATADLADADADAAPRVLSTMGYSSIAIATTLVLGGLALLVAAGCGLQRFPVDMPLAGCNSAVISAHCHTPPHKTRAEREAMATRGLMWGDVSGTERIGHLAFTDEDVIAPMRWARYAGFPTAAAAAAQQEEQGSGEEAIGSRRRVESEDDADE
ncbi:hypothetical protein EDC01DRAFT_142624 [Geopyxis carbonaria]|nr:hypothetical protein EDC01DRAFT_142624 [Geopyxis carbonaria]